MKKFCVIGNPIHHSLSPTIFRYIFNLFNINAVYDFKLIKNKESFVNFIRSRGCLYSGINITSPYKELAYSVVDIIHDSAKINKSVNCIKISNSKLVGHNTDEYGFMEMIKMNNISLNYKNIIILGYGGVAKTIVTALSHFFKCNIFILGRDDTKINYFIHSFNKSINIFKPSISKDDFVVINCLPLMIDKKNLAFILKSIEQEKINFYIDINYKETDLYKSVSEKYRSIIGLDMLIFQAIKSYNIWFEREHNDKIDYNQLKEVLINQ